MNFEKLNGLEQSGIGINAILCYLEWIFLSRKSNGKRIFTEEVTDVRNTLFVDDLNKLYMNEPIFGIAVIFGSSVFTSNETFVLLFHSNPMHPENGKQKLGSQIVEHLGSISSNVHETSKAIHILIRVQRNNENWKQCFGFTVIDEDMKIIRPAKTLMLWKTFDDESVMTNDDSYVWVLWSRDCLYF